MNIYIGNAITSSNDPLQKVPVEVLIKAIRNPKPELQEKIKQLRIAQTLDANKYKELKKQLPYFTCGNFYPAIRKKENFASIELFVLDLDHLRAANLNINVLKETFMAESEVLAYFVSPGGDGLKLIFALSEPCKDSALFSSFYKIFALKFAQKYQLTEVLDFKTSDVSRACFVSHDPDAHFKSIAETINMKSYLGENLDFESNIEILKNTKTQIQEIEKTKHTDAPAQELSPDVFQIIKQKLSPTATKVNSPSKDYFVPSQINELMPLLMEHVKVYGLELEKEEAISYGKKLRFKAGIYWAELNLFYGKKGYTVTITPKNGSNGELAELCKQVVSEFLYS